MGFADLHLHTRASDGLMSVDAMLRHAEEETHLDVVAVTDHDEVSAALWARDAADRRGYRVSVIPGVEVSTRQGHLIGLWVEERPPAFQSFYDTSEWIVRRGGLCIAPHPFARVTPSVNGEALARCVADGLVSGVEVWNPSPAGRVSHGKALAFAATHQVASIGSSDAHWRRIIGMARTHFEGTTPDELRQAIEHGTTTATGRFARPLELVLEAVPQTVWATAILPMRKVRRYSHDLLRIRRPIEQAA